MVQDLTEQFVHIDTYILMHMYWISRSEMDSYTCTYVCMYIHDTVEAHCCVVVLVMGI